MAFGNTLVVSITHKELKVLVLLANQGQVSSFVLEDVYWKG